MSLDLYVCLNDISDQLKNVHVQSKTRSIGHVLEKVCVHSRGHIFCPFLMKLGQNVRLDDISGDFENRSCWFKN